MDKNSPKDFNIEFEEGLHSTSGSITWIETNILEEESFEIRKDSSMLFNALLEGDADGVAEIKVFKDEEELTSFTADIDTPLEYKFHNRYLHYYSRILRY